MEPIELSGKVFCSNCGLTIKNNQPAPSTNTVSQQFQKVEDIATDVPEEVQFPVVPEVVQALEEKTENSPENLIPSSVEEGLALFTSQAADQTNSYKPITQSAAEELGIETTPAFEPIAPAVTADEPEMPEIESRIPDIAIPSEADFEVGQNEIEPQKSYLELANPGNELDALNASGILLDILGEESKPKLPEVKETKTHKAPRKLTVDILKDKPENPIEHPELEAAEEEVALEKPQPAVDAKTEKKIEKLEKKIEDMPEPVVELTEEDAVKYDPDTLKSQAIKEYFSSALSEARNKPVSTKNQVAKPKAKKTKKKLKEHGPALIFAITLAAITAVLLGGITYYLITTFMGL